MASAMSPTANLLRRSRLFALPQALSPPPPPLTSRTVYESETATLPYPTRAAVVTPGSSLAKGDWGLKRPLPAKATSEKSSRPVVRVVEHDTYEHVTDYESAADHVMTLEKFQELNMPVSLLAKVNYSHSLMPPHESPFESHLDNTPLSKGIKEPGVKQYRQRGPSLADMTEEQFNTYLHRVRKNKKDVVWELVRRVRANIVAQRRKEAQDKGEDLETLSNEVRMEEVEEYIKALRTDPTALGPMVFELLDLPASLPVPNARMGDKYYESPGSRMAAGEYATVGLPKTHPSGGLAYQRTHAPIYNHPSYGPQAYQRPVQARILRPKSKSRGKTSRAIIGVAGVAVEDLNALNFVEQGGPAGLQHLDPSVPGGGKYYVSPVRTYIDPDGKIVISSYRASATSRAPYGLEEYQKPTSISDAARGESRAVPRMDGSRSNIGRNASWRSNRGSEDIAKNLMKTISGS